ncbi:GerAB/ArcD/ProY family transporter [Paenibacillus eucommiae]|uniref:Spore germination protein KB n=1 Tax=Paenibacillus eucommiae TaxID=1355755 RepID=A0ABS4J4C8_9BACL|nr:endospore germination permease [Paenibacillus eucommiae]MBP1994689.1 spore germination protein KB [Paenibacillus eucommiae]
MENARISGWQFFLLSLNFMVGTAFFVRPGSIIAASKQDGWIIPLIAGIVAVLIACLWLTLASRNPGLSIVQICTKVAGKYFGGLFALLYIWFFIQIASWVTRNLGDFMKTILMPRTPISVFHLMFLIVVCYAVIKGLETIARTIEFLTPLVVLIVVVIYLFTLSEWKWERFEPMFQLSAWQLMKDSLPVIGFPYMESVMLMMIVPYVKSRVKTGLLLGIVVAALLISGIVLVTIGVLGVTRTSHFVYPLYIIVQELQIAEFIEHVESTIVIVWLIWIFIKLCISYHCAVTGICQLFRVSERTWIAIPLVLLISGIAILTHENVVENIAWDTRFIFQYSSLYGIVLPVLLLFLTWIRRFPK